ncbi:hypothetical protein [Methylobacterium sp. CM6247]
MSGPASRRGFLSGLASLPLIGGSVTLIGKPTAAAVSVTGGTVATYLAWLHFEQRYLMWGINGDGFIPMMNPGAVFHGRDGQHPRDSAREAIQRAPIMLAAAGCPLTHPEAEEQCGVQYGPLRWREGVRCA